MKQQREKRETDTSTYPGEVLNHNIQVHTCIFCFKYIRGDPVGSVNNIRYAGPSHFLFVGEFSTCSLIYLIRIFLTIERLHLHDI